APAGAPLHAADFGGPHLLGDWTTPEMAWQLVPAGMWVGAFLMVSSLRVRKLGMLSSKAATVFVMSNVAAGYLLGFARLLPEYLIVPPTLWLVLYIIKGLSSDARKIAPPPVFPEATSDRE
ncbi:MAG TPA: hypothetical protein VL172_11225, partial [Kofleriaceae bacterium]|nr:hypothetical protein [Kofleriaceae bacterium]